MCIRDRLQIEILEGCLDGKAPLPPPDLGLLRKSRDEVLAAAKHVAMADKDFAQEEQAMLQGLEAILDSAG